MRNLLIQIAAVVLFLISVPPVHAKKHAMVDIALTDGSVVKNVEFELPNFWGDNFKYIADGKKVKISADDIDHILIWHEDNPDSKAYLKQLTYGEFKHKTGEYKVNEKRKCWYILDSVGEHLAYWVAFWQMKVKDDCFEYKLGDHPSGYGGTPYFFQKAGEPVAYKIAFDPARPGMVRDWLKAFLADDPVLIEKITDKGYFNRRQALRHGNDYNPFFFEDIAQDYSPVK